jgi:uncharacterized protein YdeI (BOF family)
MTEEQKIEALVELLGDVIHTLNMKQYEIEDATESHRCEVEADQFHQKMINILYPEE